MHVIMNTLGRMGRLGAYSIGGYVGSDGTLYTGPSSPFYTAPPNYVMQSSGNAPVEGSWTKTATYEPPPASVPVGDSAGSVSWGSGIATFLKGLGTGLSNVLGPQGQQLSPADIAAMQAAQGKPRSEIPNWAIYALVGVPVVGAAAWAVTRKPKSSPAMAGYRKSRRIKRAR
jgi:hypothetical protein